MKAFKMADVLMKSLRGRKATLMYPDASAKCFEATRGRVEIDLKKCTMCGACSGICPAGAVETDVETGTWKIQRMQCVLCGQCVEICPEGCLFIEKDYAGAAAEKTLDIYDLSDSDTDDAAEENNEKNQ